MEETIYQRLRGYFGSIEKHGFNTQTAESAKDLLESCIQEECMLYSQREYPETTRQKTFAISNAKTTLLRITDLRNLDSNFKLGMLVMIILFILGATTISLPVICMAVLFFIFLLHAAEKVQRSGEVGKLIQEVYSMIDMLDNILTHSSPASE